MMQPLKSLKCCFIFLNFQVCVVPFDSMLKSIRSDWTGRSRACECYPLVDCTVVIC